MNREELLNQVRQQMTEHRFIHTKGVADTAVKLAQTFGASVSNADLAGILHDYCKYWEKGDMQQIIEQADLIAKDLLYYDKELWHAPVGAYVVKRDLGVQDPEVLSAIAFHTSGRPGMTLMEKIIWLADYIEPGRVFPGVEEVRELAFIDLDRALIKALGNTISFLARHGRKIYPLTLEAYNDLIDRFNNGKGKEISN